jgi:hypothetical protein
MFSSLRGDLISEGRDYSVVLVLGTFSARWLSLSAFVRVSFAKHVKDSTTPLEPIEMRSMFIATAYKKRRECTRKVSLMEF